MPKLKFDTTISISHIFLGLALILSVFAWKGTIEKGIADEAHAREITDTKQTASLERMSKILDDIETRVRLNDEHRVRYEGHEKWDD